MTIKMPEIGDVITVDWGLALCQYLGLDYLIERLMDHSELYNPFRFDGVSLFPDEYLGIFNGGRGHLITREALPHDLAFAYGTLEREDPEKKAAEWETSNNRFESDTIRNAHVSPETARMLRRLVELGGREEFHQPWCWGFSHVNIVQEKWGLIGNLWGRL
jgi:hypothetical protein